MCLLETVSLMWITACCCRDHSLFLAMSFEKKKILPPPGAAPVAVENIKEDENSSTPLDDDDIDILKNYGLGANKSLSFLVSSVLKVLLFDFRLLVMASDQ